MTASEQLDDIVAKCSVPNWDGYNAAPVNLESVSMARKFLIALPANIPPPFPAPCPDGLICLEWYRGVQHDANILSVDMNPTGRCAYAWLIGGKEDCNVIEFDGSKIPDQLLVWIMATLKWSPRSTPSPTQSLSDQPPHL